MKEIWRYTYAGVDYELTLEIDMPWLLQQMGPRAIKSKRLRASALAGAVIVTTKKEVS